MLNSTEDAHIKDMSTFETDEHLHAEHRYTAVGGVVGVLTFVTRELFVLFDGFTILPKPLSSGSMQGEKFSKMRVRSRLIPAMSGCDWKTDGLDLAGKSWDDACPTVRRSSRLISVHQSVHQLVGVGRFELPTPCSRSRCATRLRYTPYG